MSVNIKPYIIINGKNSNEITGLMITKLPPISKPAMRVEAEEIDGRDGDIVTELGFSAYDKEIEIGLYGEYDVNDVIEYFNQSGQVIFSNEPDKYYRFAIYNAIDFEKLINFKTATVTFHVQPFKFDVESNDAVFFSPSNVSITNEGNIYSRPEMAIQGSGNVGISVNGSDVLEIELGASQQAIIIDSDGMNAYGTKTNIKELIVDVNPVQDLHGYDSPWAGGAGKNLVDVSNATITSQTTILSNMSIKAGTYTVSFSATNNTSVLGYFNMRPSTADNLRINIPANASGRYSGTIEIPSDGQFSFLCNGQTSGYNFTISDVMLEKGSSPTSYEPYENICPISGWNGCDVTRTGANIWGGEAIANSIQNAISTATKNDANHTVTYGAGASNGKIFIEGIFKENTQYTFILTASNSLAYVTNNMYIVYTDGTRQAPNRTQAIANNKETIAYVTLANKTIQNIQGANGAGQTTIYYEESGIFEGVLTADDFQRYVGNPFTSFFEGLINGTYGFVDLGTLSWTYNASYGMSSIGIKDNVKKPSSTATIVNCICPIRKSASFSQIVSAGTSGNLIGFYTDGSLCISTTETMPTEFQTAMSGVYLIYELATPTTPTITQADINMLMTAFGIDGESAIVVFGQEVFSGTINITTGLLTINKAFGKLSDFSWNRNATYNVYYAYIANKAKGYTNIISDSYKTVSKYYPLLNDGEISGTDLNNGINIKDDNFDNVTDFINSQGNVTICYELAQPIEIQLTAQEIMTLIGENVLWANTGAINELIYTKDGVDITTSGDIVSFDVDAIDIIDTILKNRLVTGNYDNLRLKAGTNQIAVSGDVSVMVLSNFSRWL